MRSELRTAPRVELSENDHHPATWNVHGRARRDIADRLCGRANAMMVADRQEDALEQRSRSSRTRRSATAGRPALLRRTYAPTASATATPTRRRRASARPTSRRAYKLDTTQRRARRSRSSTPTTIRTPRATSRRTARSTACRRAPRRTAASSASTRTARRRRCPANVAVRRRLDGRGRARSRHGERRVPELQAPPRRGADDDQGDGLYIANNAGRDASARTSSATAGAVPSRATRRAYETYFNHAGIGYFVASGDNGNTGAQSDYPSTSAHVTAVGGTSLVKSSNARGWTEGAWSEGGSSCSINIAKPSYQTQHRVHQARGGRRRRRSAIRTPASRSTTRRTAAGSSSAARARRRRSSPASTRCTASAARPGLRVRARDELLRRDDRQERLVRHADVQRGRGLGRPDRHRHAERHAHSAAAAAADAARRTAAARPAVTTAAAARAARARPATCVLGRRRASAAAAAARPAPTRSARRAPS